ncbi:MAG: MMPL family transporter [bacterium]|nr:MMPL family transporter [bacterium]
MTGLPVGWLHRFSIRRPKTVIGLALLVTAAIAPGALYLQIRTDGHALVPADAEAVVFDRAVRDTFGVEDPIAVLIRREGEHGIFNSDTLAFIQNLTAAFGEIDGVQPENISSLDTEHNYRVRQGTLKFRTFLEPLPDTRQQLDNLRRDIRDIQLYDGTVIAFDDHAASILVGVPPQIGRAELYARIKDIVALQGDRPEQIDVIGAPVAEALLGTHILEDLGVPEFVLGQRVGRAGDEAWAWPANLYETRRFLGRHVGLVPVAIGIMVLVFLACFRSVTASVLPMIEVGACLAVVFGLMGWLDVPVYLTIAVLPVILTAMGIADEIHIFSRYTRQLRDHPEQPHRNSVTVAMDEMWRPVVKTSVTTAVAFLSFALSPQVPVKAFGVFTAVGIVFCMLWSLTVVPAQLALIPPRWLIRSQGANARPALLERVFERVGAQVTRWRYAIIVLALIGAVAAPFGVRRILVQDSWINGFSPESRFYQATQAFNDRFLGMHMLLVHVDTGHDVLTGELEPDAVGDHKFFLPTNLVDDPESLVGRRFYVERAGEPETKRPQPTDRRRRRNWKSRKSRIEAVTVHDGVIEVATPRRHALVRTLIGLTPGETLRYEITPQRLLQPQTLQRIEALEAFLEGRAAEAVGGVIGPADYIATTRFMKARREEKRCLPDSTDEVELLWADYGRIRGQERLHQIIDDDYARCLIYAFMKDANYVDTQRLMDAIRDYEREHLAPHGINLEFAGDIAVSQTLIKAIVTTQVGSLLVSLVGILVVTTILGRSLIWGVLAVLPCAFAVLVNFAVMGWVGVPLGVATSMFAGMTLGIGVDYAIHFLERYRMARARGLEQSEARADAITHTGPAVLIDALAVALGFGILMLSQVPANARLGGLVVLSIAGCLAATLLLLPALLSLGDRGGPDTSFTDSESRSI